MCFHHHQILSDYTAQQILKSKTIFMPLSSKRIIIRDSSILRNRNTSVECYMSCSMMISALIMHATREYSTIITITYYDKLLNYIINMTFLTVSFRYISMN